MGYPRQAISTTTGEKKFIGDDPIPDGYVAFYEDEEIAARAKRDELLAASDSMALADRITDEWKTYRQALRDLPEAEGFPENATWPTPPEGN